MNGRGMMMKGAWRDGGVYRWGCGCGGGTVVIGRWRRGRLAMRNERASAVHGRQHEGVRTGQKRRRRLPLSSSPCTVVYVERRVPVGILLL